MGFIKKTCSCYLLLENTFKIVVNVIRGFIPDSINPLSASPAKWSNTVKQFVGSSY